MSMGSCESRALVGDGAELGHRSSDMFSNCCRIDASSSGGYRVISLFPAAVDMRLYERHVDLVFLSADELLPKHHPHLNLLRFLRLLLWDQRMLPMIHPKRQHQQKG